MSSLDSQIRTRFEAVLTDKPKTFYDITFESKIHPNILLKFLRRHSKEYFGMKMSNEKILSIIYFKPEEIKNIPTSNNTDMSHSPISEKYVLDVFIKNYGKGIFADEISSEIGYSRKTVLRNIYSLRKKGYIIHTIKSIRGDSKLNGPKFMLLKNTENKQHKQAASDKTFLEDTVTDVELENIGSYIKSLKEKFPSTYSTRLITKDGFRITAHWRR